MGEESIGHSSFGVGDIIIMWALEFNKSLYLQFTYSHHTWNASRLGEESIGDSSSAAADVVLRGDVIFLNL